MPRDINTSSTIIGYGINGSTVHVLEWTKATATTWNAPVNLGTPPLGTQAYAYGISDINRYVGNANFVSGGQLHAFFTDPANFFTDLGTFGGLQSAAFDVNDGSGTVGWAQNTGGYHRAFLVPIDCGTLDAHPEYALNALPGVTRTDWNSEAYGVNKLSQVVGKAQNQSLVYRAFLYNPGQGVIDLNTVVLDGGQTPASLGWTLTKAQAVNDGGVIVGAGTLGGYTKSWIIYPKCQD